MASTTTSPLGMTDTATPIQLAVSLMPTRDLAEELHRRGDAEGALVAVLPTGELQRRVDEAQDDFDRATIGLEDAARAVDDLSLRAPRRDALAIVQAIVSGRADDVPLILKPYAGIDRRLVMSLAGLCIAFATDDPEDFSAELRQLGLRAAADE